MTDFKTIYAKHAVIYQHMIDYEDYQGNLLPALARLRPLAGLEVVEFGAGTGRLTVLLTPLVRRLWAFDGSAHMLGQAVSRLGAVGRLSGRVAVADNRRMPVAGACADLAIEGWSFGHLIGWHPDTWRDEVRRALGEMQRVLRPGGTAILIETLGTGRETPQPPHEGLAAFYDLLETDHGFRREWIRTDFRFESAAQGAELTRFFFGDELADRLLQTNSRFLPECTGLWWRTTA